MTALAIVFAILAHALITKGDDQATWLGLLAIVAAMASALPK